MTFPQLPNHLACDINDVKRKERWEKKKLRLDVKAGKRYKNGSLIKGDLNKLSGAIDYTKGNVHYSSFSHTYKEGMDFYNSPQWIKVRDEFRSNLISSGKEFKCFKCGGTDHVCVDHILPLRKFWQYRFCKYNLQLLCHPCNKTKGNYVDYNFLREIKDRLKEDKLNGIKDKKIEIYKI